MTTPVDRPAEIPMYPDSPAWTPGLMPPDVPVAEVRYYPTMSEQEHGDHWHAVPVEALTIEYARAGMVTVGYAGWVGDETHLYEIDLAPTAAEALALRLIRRAHEIRSDDVDEEEGA